MWKSSLRRREVGLIVVKGEGEGERTRVSEGGSCFSRRSVILEVEWRMESRLGGSSVYKGRRREME
jgi:hypothetical protein